MFYKICLPAGTKSLYLISECCYRRVTDCTVWEEVMNTSERRGAFRKYLALLNKKKNEVSQCFQNRINRGSSADARIGAWSMITFEY